MSDWIGHNHAILWWLGAIGLLTMLVSAIAIPFVVARIPADYLVNDQVSRALSERSNPLRRLVLLILKNIFGWLLILAGIVMLIAPGQGLLTVFVGLTLINFPGKRRFLRALLRRPSIHRVANWIRAKCHVAPMQLPK